MHSLKSLYAIMAKFESMSEREFNNKNNNNERKLDAAQQDQDNVGAAASNPNTNGPSENVREAAAKAEDKSEDSREPA